MGPCFCAALRCFAVLCCAVLCFTLPYLVLPGFALFLGDGGSMHSCTLSMLGINAGYLVVLLRRRFTASIQYMYTYTRTQRALTSHQSASGRPRLTTLHCKRATPEISSPLMPSTSFVQSTCFSASALHRRYRSCQLLSATAAATTVIIITITIITIIIIHRHARAHDPAAGPTLAFDCLAAAGL